MKKSRSGPSGRTKSRQERLAAGEQVKSAVDIVLAVAEAVRVAGEVPSGMVYAMLVGQVSITSFESVIALLASQRIAIRTFACSSGVRSLARLVSFVGLGFVLTSRACRIAMGEA